MSEAEWARQAEREAERQHEDRRSRREVRALTTVSLAAIAALTVVLSLGMRACSAGADRAHELEMACVAGGGTWEPIRAGGSCTQGEVDE